MSSIMGMLSHFWWLIPLVLIIVCWQIVLRLFGVVIIQKDAVGIVNKKWALMGTNKTLPDGSIIALKGEAGIQADTLAPGVHFFYWPWQYEVERVKFTTIPEDKIGIVETRDGKAVPAGRVLAKRVDCDSYQNARLFLMNGGERGPQTAIIPPGTYRINTQLFTIEMASQLEIEDNMVGIVTTKEGCPLETGNIAGPEVAGHSMYQDADAFINAGGFKGLQEQVMLAGRYFVNPRFVTVEVKPMTEVPIAHVGVVIAYVGKIGEDVSGDSFKHGNLFSRGEKGVWAVPLDPGKYPINPYTHKVELVPTANVVLNWATGKSEAHKLDANLSTITVRSSDGFKFNLDVSQIIHIPRNAAPLVIARFGSMAALVTQVLEPTIGNYFRNAAQSSDVIKFLSERTERQREARDTISHALEEYNVGAVDTLIGDIVPPDDLMTTLTDRKLAEQRKVTYDTQKMAQETRKELEQATAQADTQASVVTAERSVEIAQFTASAAVKQAEGQAKSKTINAEADAMVLITVGKAEGEKITAVGTAEADVIRLKIQSMDANNYAAIQVAQALSTSGFKLVPDIVAGGNGTDGNGLVSVLLGNIIHDSLPKKEAKRVVPVTRSTDATAMPATSEAKPSAEEPPASTTGMGDKK